MKYLESIFFSTDEVSANTPEAAEPVVTENPVSEATDDTAVEETAGVNEQAGAEPAVQSAETNAIYADMRRRAEAEARRKYEMQQAERDRQYAERFKGFTNPVTGKQITSEADYFAALDAQSQLQMERTLREKGLDPNLIAQAVAQDPTVRQAKAVLQNTQKLEAERQLQSDVAEISKIDPSIQNVGDLTKNASFPLVMKLVSENGLSVYDAYKIANFDALSARRAEAERQAAINRAKSKDHLESANSLSSPDDKTVQIPSSQLQKWRDAYPGLTDAELTAKYNLTI